VGSFRLSNQALVVLLCLLLLLLLLLEIMLARSLHRGTVLVLLVLLDCRVALVGARDGEQLRSGIWVLMWTALGAEAVWELKGARCRCCSF
jgi:hypothetical protein